MIFLKWDKSSLSNPLRGLAQDRVWKPAVILAPHPEESKAEMMLPQPPHADGERARFYGANWAQRWRLNGVIDFDLEVVCYGKPEAS